MKIVIVCIWVAMLCVAGIASCNKPEDTLDPATGSGGQGSGGGATSPASSGGTAAAAAEAAKQAEAAKAEAAKAEAAKQAEAAKAAAAKQAESAKQATGEWAASALRDPSKANLTAPPTFKAKFETSKGDFVIEVTRDWSPNGADRFYNLVKMGFYDEVRFFRVIQGFMAQFGIHGDPAVSAAWREARIPDDPVKKSNTLGHISFATGGPNTRTTQVFINYANNSRLDSSGFSPFGVVVDDGMTVVDSLYKGYGGGPNEGGRGPNQGRIQEQGNAYLKQSFANLDYVKRATIVE